MVVGRPPLVITFEWDVQSETIKQGAHCRICAFLAPAGSLSERACSQTSEVFSDELLEKGDIQADPLADLYTKDKELSVWLVENEV